MRFFSRIFGSLYLSQWDLLDPQSWPHGYPDTGYFINAACGSIVEARGFGQHHVDAYKQ